MRHSKTSIKLSVATIAPNQRMPALDHARAICGVEFDACGQHVNPGPACDHLNDNDMRMLCDMLIDASLDMLDIGKPTYGILYIHAASRIDIQAFYIPSGVIRHIDHASASTH